MFASEAEAAGWLAGIIDGEGYISNYESRSQTGAGRNREVRITNTDRGLLDAAREALDLLGVEYVERDRSERERLGTKPIFDLIISRKPNLERLAAQITLRSVKGERLHEMLGGYVRPGVPPEDVLRRLVARQTDKQIAASYNVTPGAVWAWRKKYGIERPAGGVSSPA